LCHALCGLTLAALSALSSAQTSYPNRPVKLIAPQAPGGGVDLVARIIADRLGRVLGQSIYVENQAGAGGAIATTATARAAPDGYTLMIGYVATHATNPAVKRVPYDAVKDFTPIAMVGGTPNLLVVRPSLPVTTLAELVDYAQRNPKKVNYGTSGKGTLNHLAMEQLKNAAKFESLSVPYRSIGQAFTDLMADQVQAIFPGVAAAMPHVKSGAVRPLAVTGNRRHPLLPDVPTFAELGYPGFDGVTWYGIVGPAKLPDAITKRLNADINGLLALPDLRDKLSSEALEPMPMTPDEFGRYIEREIAHWTRVARANHIELE
jgi:tripartite-type tricarboxylate transporter receptor subunit TctC